MEGLIDSEPNYFLDLVSLHHKKHFPIGICQNSIEKKSFKIDLARKIHFLLNPCYNESVN